MLEPYRKLLTDGLTFQGREATHLVDPIGVGAVGGSGTRLLVEVLNLSGVAMATPRNRAGDALEWPPFRKLLGDETLAHQPRDLLMHNILHTFERVLRWRRHMLGLEGRVGWKVPETFHWLEEMGPFFPGMQYVHLMRHGLDMAYSYNQNQARNWADRLGIRLEPGSDGRVRPASMLDYWLAANERALESAARCMPGRFLVIRFEQLCRDPETVLRELMAFLHLDTSAAHVARLAALVQQPGSVGRYRRHDWRAEFSAAQLERLERLGYRA
jgi:hypothetical protein